MRLSDKDVDVLLIVPPFGPLHTPSPAVSSLISTLSCHGIIAKANYANIRVAEKIGVEAYEKLAEGWPSTTSLFGEWLYSPSSGSKVGIERYFELVFYPELLAMKNRGEPDAGISVSVAKAQFSKFLDLRESLHDAQKSIVDDIEASKAPIVGFTSVFQQSAFSISAARRLKNGVRKPPFILIGGANCEKPMGGQLAALKDCFDIVVSGEAEQLIVELTKHIIEIGSLQENDISKLTTIDVLGRDRSGCLFVEARTEVVMSELPIPDFGDFFECAKETYIKPSAGFRGTLETSRGCWWGQKSHCTFCGLNGGNMTYRAKNASQVEQELSALQRTGIDRVDLVDNIIELSMLQQIAHIEEGSPKLFAETKSNLRPQDFDALTRLRIDQIQPGIESLNNQTLRLMKKGVDAATNINTLRSCLERGISAYWSFLWGFPDETSEEYAELIERIPFMHHLPPPTGWGPIRLDRFSPIFNRFRDSKLMQPYKAYYEAFPSIESISEFAYFFELLAPDHSRELEALWRKLSFALKDWKNSYEHSICSWSDNGTQLQIFDTRRNTDCSLRVLGGRTRELFMSIDRPVPEQSVVDDIADSESIESLVLQGLLLRSHGRLVRLPTELGRWHASSKEISRIRKVLEEHEIKVV